MMKYFHARNANRSDLPAKFHLYEHCGTWLGVAFVEDAKVQEKLASVPAIEEIDEAEYLRCVAKINNLPEHMRPAIPVHGAPRSVGDGVPVEVVVPKPISVTAALDEVLKPVKVETPAAPPTKVNPATRLGKHAVKKSKSVLPTDPSESEV